jgi:putative endonuclease
LGKGYRLLHRNWRSGHKELDIVAEHDGTLVVAEVKTRRNTRYGRPDEAVTPLKQQRLVASADAYVRLYGIDLPVRFDILELTGEAPPFRITHIEDAFFPQ